jgi:O-antigen ligase
MLATLITAVVTFVLMPKRLIHFVVFGALLVVGARLAGEDTIKRFSTMFSDELQKDGSAQSRRELWGQAFSVMLSHPLTGIGPGQWDLEVTRFGWKQGKQVHSTWLQNGAEGGVPGFVVYLAFYLVCIAQMLRISWRPTPEDLARPFLVTSARMAAAALIGFMVASQFVTVWAVEMPYYACLVGALVMKLRDSDPADQEPVEDDDVEAAWDDDDPSPLFYEPATAEFVQR